MKGRRRNLNVNEIASLGSNVKPVIQNENCAVLMLNDATGEGIMTVYRVMPGVMICFSDMHMEQCASEFELKNDRKIFCMQNEMKLTDESWISYQQGKGNEEYQKYMGRSDGYAESCTAVFAELLQSGRKRCEGETRTAGSGKK